MGRPIPLRYYLLLAALAATFVPLALMGGLIGWQYQRDVDDIARYAAADGEATARVVGEGLELLTGSSQADRPQERPQ